MWLPIIGKEHGFDSSQLIEKNLPDYPKLILCRNGLIIIGGVRQIGIAERSYYYYSYFYR